MHIISLYTINQNVDEVKKDVFKDPFKPIRSCSKNTSFPIDFIVGSLLRLRRCRPQGVLTNSSPAAE